MCNVFGYKNDKNNQTKLIFFCSCLYNVESAPVTFILKCKCYFNHMSYLICLCFSFWIHIVLNRSDTLDLSTCLTNTKFSALQLLLTFEIFIMFPCLLCSDSGSQVITQTSSEEQWCLIIQYIVYNAEDEWWKICINMNLVED